MFLNDTIKKLEDKVAKVQKKLDAYLVKLSSTNVNYSGKTFAERQGLPSSRKLTGIYRECKTWVECLEADVKKEKDVLDFYQSADFNKIRKTIKHQTTEFLNEFLKLRMEHAPRIWERNQEVIAYARNLGNYTSEAIANDFVLGWDYNKKIEGVVGEEPINYDYGYSKRSELARWERLLIHYPEFNRKYKDQVRASGWSLSRKNPTGPTIEMIKEDLKQSGILYYESALTKLAVRIMEFGLNWSKLEVETKFANLSGNLNMFLNDGNRRIEAWTIIASGPIVEAHYRFLIKERNIENKGTNN